MSEKDFETLREFLEERDVSIRAAKPLKKHTLIGMTIVGDPEPYHVSREDGKTHLNHGAPPKDPHLSFTISSAAIERLKNFESNSIGEFGVEFFKIMVSKNEDQILEVKLNTGFLGLTGIGVFGILASGGPSVMAFLARQGFKSLGDIRKALKKMRG